MNRLDRYACEQTFERLDSYLDRELTPVEMQLVKRHLEICAKCAREFEFEASVLEAIKARMRRIEAPPNLLAKISAALRAANMGSSK